MGRTSGHPSSQRAMWAQEGCAVTRKKGPEATSPAVPGGTSLGSGDKAALATSGLLLVGTQASCWVFSEGVKAYSGIFPGKVAPWSWGSRGPWYGGKKRRTQAT